MQEDFSVNHFLSEWSSNKFRYLNFKQRRGFTTRPSWRHWERTRPCLVKHVGCSRPSAPRDLRNRPRPWTSRCSPAPPTPCHSTGASPTGGRGSPTTRSVTMSKMMTARSCMSEGEGHCLAKGR